MVRREEPGPTIVSAPPVELIAGSAVSSEIV
jgi:hypothetical protein